VSGLDLGSLDRDGALREAAARLPDQTRRTFLARAGAGAAGVLAAGLAVAGAAGAADDSDISILNYALTLEYLQAAFYTEAERIGALSGVAARAAEQIGSVERAHVAALRKALGASAVGRPTFDFKGTTSSGDAFLRTAVAFEDLGTAAYKGQLGELQSPAFRAAAASIHSVEARHAAWIRYLAARPPAAEAVDQPISRSEAERIVASTGFIVSTPATTTARSPSFTG
jgi:Ferritin-like domain